MRLYDRLKVTAVLWGILVLIMGVSDAFVDSSSVGALVFDSYVFYIAFTVVCLLIAPLFSRYVPVRTPDGRSFGLVGVVLFGVGVVVLGILVITDILRH